MGAGNDTKIVRRLAVRLFGQVSSSRSSNPNSLDTEGLFDLEGMEEVPTESFHSEEETDTDGGYMFLLFFFVHPKFLDLRPTGFIEDLLHAFSSPVLLTDSVFNECEEHLASSMVWILIKLEVP
jgi:hypothetical protein